MDLLYMEIDPLDTLPEPMTDTVLRDQLKENLYIFLSNMFPDHKYEKDIINQTNIDEKEEKEEKEEIQLFVEKEYMKKLKKPMNTTFKHYNKKSCKKYTIKSYDNSGR